MEIALPRTACLPPPAFSSSLPDFFSKSNYIKLSNCFLLFGHLSHGHETTSAPASTASTTTPGPITAASSRRRSPCAESATRALFAWPPAWRGIVNNCKSRPAREHCNQRIGCCSPVRCIALRTAALLYCCTGLVRGWMVGGGWWMAARSLPEMAEYRQKMKLPPSVSCFIQGSNNQPTNCSPRTGAVAALLFCCM